MNTLIEIVGPELVRRATNDDIAAEGINPEWFAEPRTEAEVARILNAARQSGVHVIPCGGGSKITWGQLPPVGGLLLSTRGLGRVLDHAAGDMTATVEAGCKIAALQQSLARHGQPHGLNPVWPSGQRLALDPMWPEAATVGGVIATNDSGPLRAGFGSLRDLLLGVTVALSDGTLASSGGKVVKNVAGYDLPKLMIGAFGTLGVITRATFRLHPVPRAYRTMKFFAPAPDEAQEFVLAMQKSGPPVTGLQFSAGSHEPCRVAVGLEGSPAGVHASAIPVTEIAARCGLTDLMDTWDPWRERERLWVGAVVKVTFLPTQLALVCRARSESLGPGYWYLVAQGVGVGLLSLGDCYDDECAGRVARFGQKLSELGGSLAVLRGHRVLKQRLLGLWKSDSLPLMKRLKEQFDPSRTLNPGRFVGGI